MILHVSWDGLWTLSLGSHRFMVTALGSCVKWPLDFHGHGSWTVCYVTKPWQQVAPQLQVQIPNKNNNFNYFFQPPTRSTGPACQVEMQGHDDKTSKWEGRPLSKSLKAATYIQWDNNLRIIHSIFFNVPQNWDCGGKVFSPMCPWISLKQLRKQHIRNVGLIVATLLISRDTYIEAARETKEKEKGNIVVFYLDMQCPSPPPSHVCVSIRMYIKSLWMDR